MFILFLYLSIYLITSLKVVVPRRMVEMENAILTRNYKEFAELTMKDSNSFHAVCLGLYLLSLLLLLCVVVLIVFVSTICVKDQLEFFSSTKDVSSQTPILLFLT